MDNSSDKDQWVLTPAERSLVMAKNRANRLGFGYFCPSPRKGKN